MAYRETDDGMFAVRDVVSESMATSVYEVVTNMITLFKEHHRGVLEKGSVRCGDRYREMWTIHPTNLALLNAFVTKSENAATAQGVFDGMRMAGGAAKKRYEARSKQFSFDIDHRDVKVSFRKVEDLQDFVKGLIDLREESNTNIDNLIKQMIKVGHKPRARLRGDQVAFVNPEERLAA